MQWMKAGGSIFCNQGERVEIVLQWIQQLVVDRHLQVVLDVPPPVLPRVFQELSRGIVNVMGVFQQSQIRLHWGYFNNPKQEYIGKSYERDERL